METLVNLHPQIVAKAWQDHEFRSQLIADPKGTLDSLGGEFAGAVRGIKNIKVLADTADTIHLVLPTNPVESEELSESFLERVSDSNSNTLKGCTMKGPNCATQSYTRPCSRACR